MQKCATVGVDRRSALQVATIPLVERGLAALAPFGLDHGLRQFDLAQFQHGRPRGRLQGPPRRETKGKAEAVGTA